MPEIGTSVFISYSHADASWLSRLQVHLKPLERSGRIERWDDTMIAAGDKWRSEIELALEKSKIAILLISADFIASDFISNNELPPLLKAAESRGLTVLPLILSHSAFLRTPELSQFQAANSPDHPLDSLQRHEQEKILDSLAARISSILPSSLETSNTNSRSTAPSSDVNHTLKQNSLQDQQPKTSKNELVLLNINNDFELIAPLLQAKGGDNLELIILAESSEDSHLMRRVQREYIRRNAFVAYANTVFYCEILDVKMSFLNRTEQWEISVKRIEINDSMRDININGVSPDDQAKLKAKKILLNLSEDNLTAKEYSQFEQISRLDRTLMTPSPIPIIYNENRSSAHLFDILRLKAALQLYAAAVITEIHKLDYHESEGNLFVDFYGERRSSYFNSPSTKISISGRVDIFQS